MGINKYRCWAEVNLTTLRENLVWIKDRVGSHVKIMTVVKADAYGHGLKQIAAQLMQSGTDVFGVANLAEAAHIRAIGPGWPILMLGACLPEEVALAVKDGVMPTISTWQEALAFSSVAEKLKKTSRIHIKIDTGMGRLGMEPEESLVLIPKIMKLPGIKIEGIFTHYSSVEDDEAFSAQQSRMFRNLIEKLRSNNVEIPLLHANSSGALLHEPKTIYNLVRPGLIVYGIVPQGKRAYHGFLHHQVKPVLSFKSRISLVKQISVGKTISYGHTFVADKPMKVATVTAGYGDGYLRAASNRGQVLINGTRCPILGRITMDQMIVDVTCLPNVCDGDVVTLIGCQGNQTITANDVATWMNTIPWEVLTNITYRVPRVYLGGEAS